MYKVIITRHDKNGVITKIIDVGLAPMTHKECRTFISKQSDYKSRGFLIVKC